MKVVLARQLGWKKAFLLQMITNVFFRKINDNLCLSVYFHQESLKKENVGSIFHCHNGVSLLPRWSSMYWKLLVVNSPGTQATVFLPPPTPPPHYPFNFSLFFKFDFIRFLSKAIKLERKCFPCAVQMFTVERQFQDRIGELLEWSFKLIRF